MKPTTQQRPEPSGQPQDSNVAAELQDWFSVSGDMDDFIYYGETPKLHSEK